MGRIHQGNILLLCLRAPAEEPPDSDCGRNAPLVWKELSADQEQSCFISLHYVMCHNVFRPEVRKTFPTVELGGSRRAVSGNNGGKIPCWF